MKNTPLKSLSMKCLVPLLFLICLAPNAITYAKNDSSHDTLISITPSRVHIGYGEQKKSNVTGSISSIGGKEITLLKVASVESALQGQVAGVSVVNEGGPGVDPIVRIRGNGSITYASTPLYVVDGIPTNELGS